MSLRTQKGVCADLLRKHLTMLGRSSKTDLFYFHQVNGKHFEQIKWLMYSYVILILSIWQKVNSAFLTFHHRTRIIVVSKNSICGFFYCNYTRRYLVVVVEKLKELKEDYYDHTVYLCIAYRIFYLDYISKRYNPNICMKWLKHSMHAGCHRCGSYEFSYQPQHDSGKRKNITNIWNLRIIDCKV